MKKIQSIKKRQAKKDLIKFHSKIFDSMSSFTMHFQRAITVACQTFHRSKQKELYHY